MQVVKNGRKKKCKEIALILVVILQKPVAQQKIWTAASQQKFSEKETLQTWPEAANIFQGHLVNNNKNGHSMAWLLLGLSSSLVDLTQ